MSVFLEFLRSRERQYGDREVLRVDGVARRYDELLATTLALAGGLGQAGVDAEDHIALMMDTSNAAVDAWLASSVIGGYDIPINTAYRGELLRYLIEDSEATVVICDDAHLGTLLDLPLARTKVCKLVVNAPATTDLRPTPGIETHRLSDLYVHGSPLPSRDGASGIVVLYTSGTTGASKGVMHTQDSCLELAEFTARTMRYTPEDALLNFFPLYHQNARYTGLIPAIAAGARFQLESKLSTSRFWSRCRDDRITAFNYLGSVLTMIMAASKHLDAAQARDHSVRKAYGAGAPRGIWEEFERRFGVELFEAYGLTEAPMVSINVPPRVSPIGSAGRASELFEVQALDELGERVVAGLVGEIVVRPKLPHGFMLGYYGRDADTVRATRNLWFHTGDRGWLSPAGDVHFEERAKDSIRRRGENISAWEVESVLDRHPAVLESAVYGVAADAVDEEVMAAVVLSNPDADLGQIILESASDLPTYAVPRYVRAVTELPRTDTMKVQKAELRKQGVTADTLEITRETGVR
ncbi:MAG: AMP-binding protein [Sciscionella sp.]